MSTLRFRTSNAHFAMYQKLQGLQCTKDYYNSKTDIEKQIAKIDKTSPRYFCNNCSKIKEIINRKDREFKGCLTDTSKPLKLIGVDADIQRFIGECTTFQECFSKRSARNNQVSLKSTNTDQCEKNSRCNNGNSRTGGMGSKQQQRLITEKSKTESSPRQKPQSTGAEQAEGKDSKQKMLVSETPMIANALPNFVKTQHGGSESVNNNQSTTSAQVDPSSQPSTVPGHKSPTEEDNHAISPTQLSRFGQKPDSGISVQQIHTDENPVPKNSPDDQLYRNTPGEGDTTEQIVLGQDIARQGDVTETPDSEVLASKGSVQTYPSRTNADGLQPSSSDTSNVVATRVHVENSHSHTVNTYGDTSLKVNGEAVHHEHLRSTVPEIKDSGTERPADSDTIHDNIPNVGRDDTNISDVNAAGDESRSGEGLCTEPPCITEKGNILTDEKSDVFRRIFEAISNKDHIIQASAPMGIVLLLSLLFKFTPLWRVLTKKNRKIGAGINEELNSVLQEPSIMDDERSIPYSYGAFEYSAFDQNVY